jgi:plasmid stability protein
MTTITIDNLSAQTWAILSERARAHRKSIEEEAAAILERATSVERTDRSERQRSADEIAAMTPKGVVQDDSALFIRAERERSR